jgi:hypothetical protein
MVRLLACWATKAALACMVTEVMVNRRAAVQTLLQALPMVVMCWVLAMPGLLWMLNTGRQGRMASSPSPNAPAGIVQASCHDDWD